MKNLITSTIAIGIISIAALAIASGTQKQKTENPAPAKAIETPAPAEVAAGPIKVRGVMKKSEEGLSLFDGKKTYQLAGFSEIKGMNADAIEKMVGKLVSISGDLEKRGASARIMVKEVLVVN